MAVRTLALRTSVIVATVGRSDHTVSAGCADGVMPEQDRSTVRCIANIGGTATMRPSFHTDRPTGRRAATASILLEREGVRLGALHLWSAEPRPWRPADLDIAHRLGTVAATHIDFATRLWQQEQLVCQLSYALEARIIVEQAKGIIANDRQIDVEKAYELIRRHARRHNATVRAVSNAIVHAGMRVAR
ncbi:ANTAR domain-containing protein [Rhodococcoides yunnanense]|uniref:ANTAR domain-containing protein n=1 Tax=Rhodococcoides yunnanense TaxID=278209 RepID=UPI0014744BA5|nr:ANTAR domain-containing protein [Rhodococcus yunnanensis]